MNKFKNFYTITIILTLIVLSFGATYAYLSATATTKDNPITTESASYSLNLSVTPKYPNPQNGPYTLIPMKDELSDKGYIGYNNNPCIDKNNATVCYAYEIKVYDYNAELEYLSGSINIETSNIASLSYRIYDENNNPVTLFLDEDENPIYYNSIISKEELTLGDSFNVKNKASLTLTLLIWLSDTGVNQNATDIGTFNGNVTFYAGKGGMITGKISSLINGNYEG